MLTFGYELFARMRIDFELSQNLYGFELIPGRTEEACISYVNERRIDFELSRNLYGFALSGGHAGPKHTYISRKYVSDKGVF